MKRMIISKGFGNSFFLLFLILSSAVISCGRFKQITKTERGFNENDSISISYSRNSPVREVIRLDGDKFYFCNQKIALKNSTVEINLPSKYIMYSYIEDMGEYTMRTIHFESKSGLILSQGCLYEINFDSVIPVEESKSEDFESRKGKTNDGYWRLDRYSGGIIIGYFGVSDESKDKYDSILKTARIDYGRL